MDCRPTTGMELREIVADVEGERSTLALCNVDAPGDMIDAVGGYLGPRHVAVRHTSTAEGVPENVAILHDGEQFRAASDLRDLYRFADPAVGAHTADDIEAVEVPAVVRELDDTTFSDYGQERMVVASREIEKRAWNAGSGTLHTGFQRLSLVASQRSIYRKLAGSDLDVHVYGVPDADSPDLDVAVHGHDTEEMAESWFVVFEGSDGERSALLALETAERNTYRGFWTYRAEVVDRILDRLQEAYLPGPQE